MGKGVTCEDSMDLIKISYIDASVYSPFWSFYLVLGIFIFLIGIGWLNEENMCGRKLEKRRDSSPGAAEDALDAYAEKKVEEALSKEEKLVLPEPTAGGPADETPERPDGTDAPISPTNK